MTAGSRTATTSRAETDIASAAALFADPTRARVLVALGDGRALAASVLAAEAGVTAQAASAQLARLRDAGLLAVERSGRRRYYRLGAAGGRGPGGARAAGRRSAGPVRSLRQATRAAAARTRGGRSGYQRQPALVAEFG
jgi:DNA-binding transcriptional ArsR family regulator